jgi:16S rRNA (uracil1498-N3)-methyltransferase
VNVLTALIALPNRAEKSEIIVQKLGEIGIDHIVWYTGHYSQLRDCSEKKITRMQTIALEASEQSHNRTVPTIAFVPDLKKYITKNNNQAYILYDCPSDQQIPNETVASPLLIKRGLGEICGETQKTFIIGAEGGFGKGDYEIFDMIKNLTHGNLGDSILRMETAAIVAGWLLRN